MARAKRHPVPRRRPRSHDDQGAILALWVFCLTVLTGCLALAINLGNLAQEAVNVQNAADSAALAGAQTLAPALNSLVDQFVPITPSTCRVTTLPSRITCTDFTWLDGHYLYDSQTPAGADCPAASCAGWWQIVPTPQAPGQISDAQAFQDATSAGAWTCAYSQVVPHGRHFRYYCGALDAAPTGPNGVPEAEANWDLSAALPANPALTATNNAMATTSDYDLHAQWSACGSSVPPQFFLAEGWNGTTCLAYEITGNPPNQKVVFWARLDINNVWRTAWATSPPGRLCARGPVLPTANCQ